MLGFVPSVDGFWKIQVQVDFNNEILVTEIEVGEGGVNTIINQLNQIMDGDTGLFVPGDSLHDLHADMRRVLGLLHDNAILDKQVYDAEGQLIAARLRVFTDEALVPLVPDGNETAGLLHEYTIDADWNGFGIATLYRLLRVL